MILNLYQASPLTLSLIHISHSVRRLRPTKGVHIVYRGEISPSAFLLQSRQDRRIFFIIPFKGNSLIGTTDTDYHQSPDKVDVEETDIQYLLQEDVYKRQDMTRGQSLVVWAIHEGRSAAQGVHNYLTVVGETRRVVRT